MPKFKVSVVRIGYASMEMEIEADDAAQAKDKALDSAGDQPFSEHASEYKVEWIDRQIPSVKSGVEWVS